MLNLDLIASRVDRGLGTPEDSHMMLEELRRLYGEPSSSDKIKMDVALTAQALADADAKRAKDAAAAAQLAAADAAAKAKSASDVTAALQKASDAKKESEQEAFNEKESNNLLSFRQQIAKSLKDAMEVPLAETE